ncbi:MAG: hypothetical protein AAF327_19285 [Cyanobacteria bacterium P01_A01_bin.37]
MYLGFVFAAILALVHVVPIDVEALTLIPREKWFSFTGGVVSAYVVLDILPRLSQSQVGIHTGEMIAVSQVDISIYCLILVGILVFYGLEKLVWRSRQINHAQSAVDCTSPGILALHLGALSVYIVGLNFLQIGYRFESLIIERSLLFTVLVLHFIVNNHWMLEHHKRAYRRIGRWVIVAVLLISAATPKLLLRDVMPFDHIWAFSGGVLLASGLKEEISAKTNTCFWSFSFGVVIFSIVLLLL